MGRFAMVDAMVGLWSYLPNNIGAAVAGLVFGMSWHYCVGLYRLTSTLPGGGLSLSGNQYTVIPNK